MRDKFVDFLKIQILDRNIFLFLFLLFMSIIFFKFKSLAFFNDELIVNSKGFFTFQGVFDYSSYSSYHPPLIFYFHKLINELGSFQERYYRFVAIFIYCSSFILAWLINSSRHFRLTLVFISITSYFYYFSVIVTNYVLGYSSLIVFLALYLKQRDKNTNFINQSTILIAVISFLSNYVAGYTCFAILLIDGLFFNKKRTINLALFELVFLLSTFLINFVPSYINTQVLTISFAIIILNIILYRPKQLLIDVWVIHIAFTWIAYRFLNYMNVKDLHELAYKPNHLEYISSVEFLPYILAIFLTIIILVSKFNQIKNVHNKRERIFAISFLISIAPLISLVIGGKQIYARYFIFSIPLLYLLISNTTLKLKLKNYLLISLLSVISVSLYIRHYDVSYLGIHNSRSIYEKVTSHGKYGKFILFFSDKYSWHKFYLEDYKIEKNFKFFTFLLSCNKETFKKAIKMAGENSFFVNYYNDCPELKEYLLNNCEKYDSQCFDLGAEDGDVILKMFEPGSQKDKIQELESTYGVE